jgi:hypothetical protein
VRLTNSASPRTVKAYVPAGNHRIRWIYSKNEEGLSGEDKAKIYMIEVVGNKQVDDYCSPCVPGTYASSFGMTDCQECPIDTFTNTFGNSDCIDCPPNQYAFLGQTSCSPRTRMLLSYLLSIILIVFI